jgi:polyisoprenoid-binding protein YceI
MFLRVCCIRRISLLILSGLLCCALAQAQQKTFTLDPAQTKVNFTVDATLHTVHGDFRLKRGSIRFDSANGQAGGELVVDATSGESGNDGRDKKMHKEILESPKYSDIVFTPQHIRGTVAVEGKSQVEVEGVLTMHGKSLPVTLPLQVQLQGGAGTGEGSFTVKYREWGLKNPSTFILRVSDKVEIHVHAVGRMAAAASQ